VALQNEGVFYCEHPGKKMYYGTPVTVS